MRSATARANVGAGTLTAALLCERLAGGPLPAKQIRALHAWLTRVTAATSDDNPLELLALGLRWLRRGATKSSEPAPVARLRLLIDAVDLDAQWRAALVRLLGGTLAACQVEAFFEVGLPNDRGLFAETSDRLARRVLPAHRQATDLVTVVDRLVPSTADADWIAALPDDVLRRLAPLLGDAAWQQVRPALLDAVALIATRTSALGLSPDIRARSPEVALAASPFFLLPRLCDALFTGLGSATSCLEQIAACRHALASVQLHLEEHGVSVDVVYRMDVIEQNLERVGDLVAVIDAGPEDRALAVGNLAARLIGARADDRSLRQLARANVRLLARKVIERAGQSGEHYITTTRAEYARMCASAAGGGVLTAATTVLKYLILWGNFPLFVEGALASINYAGSFLLMQLCGFTLATKQPAMIAAALAGALRRSATATATNPTPSARRRSPSRTGRDEDEPELGELVTLITRICRSQFIAAVGNVAAVIPVAFAFHLLYLRLTGHPFLDEKAAEHTLHSFDPLRSGTVVFAALTGVFLWLSSLGAGWLENWFAYRRIPEALADRGRVGAWVARKLSHGIAGVGGNITIGVLLGMMPVFGKFFGVPLEVRHVTLATGSLVLAVSSLGERALGAGLVAATCGIAVILSLNFGVSFALALGVAMRACGAERSGSRLLGAVCRRFVASPLEFLFPSSGRG